MKRFERSRSMPAARLLLAAALATACHATLAQESTVPPAVSVQRLAPQLLPFAGSEANFQSLVNGLASGTQVQLFTVLPNGFIQNVSFTPTAALPPAQVAQILETARQQLIGLGIGAPTAEQLGFALMGGVVPTALGGTQVPGALNAQTPQSLPSAAAQMQGQASAGATAPTITNSVNVQTTPGAAGATAGVAATLPRPNTSDSAIPAGATSRSVSPITSASPTVSTSASPLATTPVQAPAVAPAPRTTTERVPAGARPARN
jgi:hypothetical protein